FEGDLWDLVLKNEHPIGEYEEEECVVRREHDNAIFIVACAAALYGTDKFSRFYDPGAGQKTFLERYGWLMDDRVPDDPYEYWLKALHKLYVSGGIFDDFQGVEDDQKLGLITYPVYLQEVKEMPKDQIWKKVVELSGKYVGEARALGMGRVITAPFRPRLENMVAYFPQWRKAEWAKQELSLEELREGGVVYLREKLNARGYLD
ncbi:MAG TPA: hypothetical protein VMX77_02300, partial [Candidatus Bathyarchaeia archaeon]|nr:hypothetical protein [Candidatus Bathyarchaeia archaeon]